LLIIGATQAYRLFYAYFLGSVFQSSKNGDAIIGLKKQCPSDGTKRTQSIRNPLSRWHTLPPEAARLKMPPAALPGANHLKRLPNRPLKKAWVNLKPKAHVIWPEERRTKRMRNLLSRYFASCGFATLATGGIYLATLTIEGSCLVPQKKDADSSVLVLRKATRV